MTRAKIIDIIKSAVGGVLRIDNLAEYKNTYVEADMTANTLVPYSIAQGLFPPEITLVISAGATPTTLVNGVDFNTANVIPIVLQCQPILFPSSDPTKLTTEGASLRVDYQYSDSSKSSLVSIDVWVADNTIDTWIRII